MRTCTHAADAFIPDCAELNQTKQIHLFRRTVSWEFDSHSVCKSLMSNHKVAKCDEESFQSKARRGVLSGLDQGLVLRSYDQLESLSSFN